MLRRALPALLLLLLAGCTSGPDAPQDPTGAPAMQPPPVSPTLDMTSQACAARVTANATALAPADANGTLTAREALPDILRAARLWAEDAQLFSLTSPNVTREGRASSWGAGFASASRASYSVVTRNTTGMRCEVRTGSSLPPVSSIRPMNVTIDSTDAMAAALALEHFAAIADQPEAAFTLGATVHPASDPDPGPGWRAAARVAADTAYAWIPMPAS